MLFITIMGWYTIFYKKRWKNNWSRKDDEIAENQHMRIVVDPASDSESLHLPEGDEDSEPEVPSGKKS